MQLSNYSCFLFFKGELEVTYGDMPLSIQQAQTLMLQDAHQMDMFIVYTHLTRNGCKVIRHQPHLLFTRMYNSKVYVINLDNNGSCGFSSSLKNMLSLVCFDGFSHFLGYCISKRC